MPFRRTVSIFRTHDPSSAGDQNMRPRARPSCVGPIRTFGIVSGDPRIQDLLESLVYVEQEEVKIARLVSIVLAFLLIAGATYLLPKLSLRSPRNVSHIAPTRRTSGKYWRLVSVTQRLCPLYAVDLTRRCSRRPLSRLSIIDADVAFVAVHGNVQCDRLSRV
jgi:hypothetical protein